MSRHPDPSRGFTDPPARGGAERWRVALTQQDLRWMTTEEITQAFKDGAVKSETFVFRAGMPTWVTLLEVSEIAQALADAHLVSPPLKKLHFDEQDAQPPSPPQRISSLPPPRKAAHQRTAQPLDVGHEPARVVDEERRAVLACELFRFAACEPQSPVACLEPLAGPPRPHSSSPTARWASSIAACA